jgi:hypothetical protein
VAIAVHIVMKPQADARDAYEASWRRLVEQGARDPKGRQSHTAWLVGDVAHVLDVWDSEADMNAFMSTTAGPLMQEFGAEPAGPPEVGQLVHIVQPD